MILIDLKKTQRIIDFTQSAYIINSFFITLFFFTLVLIGFTDIAIKIVYYSSISIFVTQIFSINARNIGITDGDVSYINQNLSFRLLSSPILFLVSIFCYKFFLNEKINELLIYTNLIIYLIWIFELCLALIEIKKRKVIITLYYLYFLSIFIIIFFIDKTIINNFILFFLVAKITLLSFILIHFKFKLNFSKYNLFKNRISNLLQENFYSSLSLTSLNLLIRLTLYKFYNLNNLEIIYLCLSIYSLPGSLVSNSFGASLFPSNKSLPLLFKLIIYVLFIIILILSFILFLIDHSYGLKIYKIEISVLFLYIALVSGIFQYLGQAIRIIRLSNKYFRVDLLEADIVFSILGSINLLFFVFIIPEFIIYMIIINSIVSMAIYLGYKRTNTYKI